MTEPTPKAEQVVLLHAIRIEVRNGMIYESLAGVFGGFEESVRALFLEMAEEERRHQVILEAQYQALYGPIPGPSASEPTDIIERADIEDGEAFLFDSMTVTQALESGLKAEREAREFYERERARTSDPELEKVYRELGAFEGEHVGKLEAKLDEHRKSGSKR